MSPSARLVRRQLRRLLTGGPPRSIEQQRVDLEAVMRRVPVPRGVQVVGRSLAGRPALRCTPRVVGERAVLYLHGGAYTLGSPRTHLPLACRLARAAAATVWALDYRLAPEHPHPAAVEDAAGALASLAATVGAGRVGIAGDSAGAGVALAALHTLRDQGGAMPGGGVLLSPWLDLTLSGETIRTRADVESVLDAGWLETMAELYAPGRDRGDPAISPLFAEQSALPPLLVQVGDDEVLLSDAQRFVDRARARGADVRLDLWPDMWHAWPVLAPLFPEARRAVQRAGRFLQATVS